jgi:hypothetical protein
MLLARHLEKVIFFVYLCGDPKSQKGYGAMASVLYL